MKWSAIACGVALVACIALIVKSSRESGVGVCVPDRIENSTTNAKNVTAEIHLCGESLGYYYYLETQPLSSLFERRPSFPEGLPAPKLEWVDDKTLKIIMPKNMKPNEEINVYAGIHLNYENTK